MTISCLHHTQGIRGYKCQKTERTKDAEIYFLHSKALRLPCPACGSRETSVVQTGNARDIRGLCIGLKKRLCAQQHAGYYTGSAGLLRNDLELG